MPPWFNTRNISELNITGMPRFFVLPIFFEAKLDFLTRAFMSRGIYISRDHSRG